MRIHSYQNQETYRIVTSKNWSDHSMGPVEKWNSVLIHSLNIIFNSHQPSFIFWGPDAICFYNDGYIPILGSGKHPQSLGAPAEKVWNEIWTVDTNPQYLEAMKGKATWNVDRMVPIERNGKVEEAYFTYGYSPLYLENGQINGVIVTALETTSTVEIRKNLEKTSAELTAERQKLEALFESAPAALAFWAGEDMIFDRVNPEYQKIFPGRQLQGLPLLEAVPEFKGQGFFELLQKVLHTGEPFIGKEVMAMIPDEQGKLHERYYDFSYLQIRDVEGKPSGVFDHAIDVTDRVKLTREREDEKMIREKFVAALTHDLRTPLTAAKISAQLLFRTDNELQKQKLLTRVVQNIDRSDDMIRDLLDANRMKAGESIPIEKKPIELRSFLTDIIEELSSIHGARFKLEAITEIHGQWDGNAILRIMENLLSNAIKYGDNSTIKVKLAKKANFAVISVCNNGNVIKPEDQLKIFSAYHRTADAHQSSQKGWGIGLSLVQALTQAHNGNVTVQSTKETGTIFTVTLPLES